MSRGIFSLVCEKNDKILDSKLFVRRFKFVSLPIIKFPSF